MDGIAKAARSPSLSAQQVWATIGLAIFVLVAVVAAGNLQGIYNSQKDFVIGSLLSLVGFCFGKAFSRTQEERAVELIHTSSSPQVAQALTEKIVEEVHLSSSPRVVEALTEKIVEEIHLSSSPAIRDALSRQRNVDLHGSGVFAELSVLERNVNAAWERLSEYYDAQCRKLNFHQDSGLLAVALDDLDKTAANAVSLRNKLGKAREERVFAVPDEVRAMLTTIRRSLREAVNRRDQAYEWLKPRLHSTDDQDVWDLFAVMTSDMLKGLRSLEVIFGRHLLYPLEEYHRTILGYLRVAAVRAEQFREAAAEKGTKVPTIFDVMVEDIRASIELLGEIDFREQLMQAATATGVSVR